MARTDIDYNEKALDTFKFRVLHIIQGDSVVRKVAKNKNDLTNALVYEFKTLLAKLEYE